MRHLGFRHILLIISLAGLATLTNCGKKKATGNGGEQSDGNGADAPKPKRWVKVAKPAEKALAYSNHLMMTGDYPRAIYVLENLGEKYPDKMPPTVGETLERLRAIKKTDEQLAPTLKNIAAENAQLMAAIDEAGKDGLVVLRRHMLESKDPAVATAIAKHLAKVDDIEGGIAMYTLLKDKRCKAEQAAALAPYLKSMLKKHSNQPPFTSQLLEEFAMNVVTEESDEKANVMRSVLAAWNLNDLPKETLDEFSDLIRSDGEFERIHLMEIMTILFVVYCNADEAAFNGRFSMPQYPICSNYLVRASADPRNSIKRIVNALGKSFGLPDQEALEDQMALHYKLNEPASAIRVYDSRSQSHLTSTKLSGQLAANALVPALDGNGLKFRGNGILKLSKKSPLKHKVESRKTGRMITKSKPLNVLMKDNYSFSIWIKPTQLPNGSDWKTPTVSLIARELIPVGLRLHRNGTVSMKHPVESNPCIATSTQRVPVGQWTHVAAVVNRKQGTVQIFINGKPAGESRFRAGSSIESTFIRESHFLVGGTTDLLMRMGDDSGKTRFLDNAYVGLVDEIRLYYRDLSPKEVKQIYDIHAGLAR